MNIIDDSKLKIIYFKPNLNKNRYCVSEIKASSLLVYWFVVSQTSKQLTSTTQVCWQKQLVDFKNTSAQVLSQVSVFVSALVKQRCQLNWQEQLELDHKRRRQSYS